MRDPFKPSTNKQLVREAQFGFSVIGLLVATLIYVAWFRISGVNDTTPDHVRDAPVAMKVYPNSPNYDPDTHRMTPQVPSFANAPPPIEKTTFTTAPKRVLSNSTNTARSLQNETAKPQEMQTRVSALANEPKDNKPFGLVSNPAASGLSESGFKVLERPKPSNEFKPEPIALVPLSNESEESKPRFGSLNAKQKAVSTQSRFNTGRDSVSKPATSSSNRFSNSFKPTPPVVTQPTSNAFQPIKSKSRIQFDSFEMNSSSFKPVPSRSANSDSELKKPASAKPRPTEPNSSDPIVDLKLEEPAIDEATKGTGERLPTLQDQALSTLRPPLPEAKAASTAPKSPKEKTANREFDAKPVSFEKSTWAVEKGDSFWSIAQTSYGDGRFFRALYEQNRREVPGFENLTEGIELDLPTADELCQRYPELCPPDAVHKNDPWRATPDKLMEDLTEACECDLNRRLYETKANDTLFEIARGQLGQASRYVELIELNRFRIDTGVTHETELPPGIELVLPAK